MFFLEIRRRRIGKRVKIGIINVGKRAVGTEDRITNLNPSTKRPISNNEFKGFLFTLLANGSLKGS